MSKKILSILLSLTILIGILSVIPITADAAEADLAEAAAEVYTADTSAAYSADWRLWSQGASDYAIMRRYGCWVVAMSKMFRQSEIATDITPDDFYWWERNNGYLPDNDYNLNQVDGANAPVAFAASRGKTLKLQEVKSSPSTDDLWSYINSGYYTIVKVNASYDHYVYIENSSSRAQRDIRILESFKEESEVGSYSLAERYGGAVTAYVYYNYNHLTDYQYTLHDDGTTEIKLYTGPGGDVTIPRYLGGYSVTTIGGLAFHNSESLSGVTIPDSVTSIGIYAFSGCSGLTSVTIPNSVTTIGDSAFEGCKNLTSVTIPNSVIIIGDGTFSGCTSLTSVNIPDSVTYIGDCAFSSCTGLTSVTIPNSVTGINQFAFYNCDSLKSVTIPNSVMYIGYYAFGLCESLTSVSIPNSITEIGELAFEGCTNLMSLTIPNSFTDIRRHAFGYHFSNKITDFTIFGAEGSTAQTYANENGFKFMKITEKTDVDTGIIIYAPEDVSVKAQVIDLAEDAVKAILMNHGFVSLVAVYDITMWLYEESVQPDAPVPVSIPCTNEKTKVYRQEEDGSLTDMNASYEDGYMVFYTDHFSTYILAVPEEEGEPYILGDVDGDGDVSAIDATYVIRYSAQIDVQLDEADLMRGDVDGNEEIEIVDATYIQRYLAEFNIPYPIGEPI